MLSVIIPTYNRNSLLQQCLLCLVQDKQLLSIDDYEVIVSDDSKEHVAKELIDENFPWVKWIAGPQKGPSANRNFGAKNALGEWLIFIDDDCLPNADLLINYKNATKSQQDTQVFEGRILADREQRSFAEESPINDDGGYLWSCNFMIDKNSFLHILGGFDENFPFAAMEDVELDYRIKKKGLKKLFLKGAIVIHPWRKQTKMWQITFRRFKSTLYYLSKHPEKKKEINSKYYLTAFYNSFLNNTLKNGIKYKFRGLKSKLIYDFLQLYFSIFLLFKNSSNYSSKMSSSHSNQNANISE